MDIFPTLFTFPCVFKKMLAEQSLRQISLYCAVCEQMTLDVQGCDRDQLTHFSAEHMCKNKNKPYFFS